MASNIFDSLFEEEEETPSLMDVRPGSVQDTVVERPEFTPAPSEATAVDVPKRPDEITTEAPANVFDSIFEEPETIPAEAEPENVFDVGMGVKGGRRGLEEEPGVGLEDKPWVGKYRKAGLDVPPKIGGKGIQAEPELEKPKTPVPYWEKKEERTFWENAAESFKRGDEQAAIDAVLDAEFQGNVPKGTAQKLQEDYEHKLRTDPVEARNLLEKGFQGALNMIPHLTRGGAKGMFLGGGLAAATLALTKQPALAKQAYGLGMAAGSTDYWRRQGRNEAFRDQIKAGVPENIARISSEIVAIPYALVETSQAARLVPRPVAAGINKAIGRAATRFATDFVSDASIQTGQEGLQKFLTTASTEVSKYSSGLKDVGQKEIAQSVAQAIDDGVVEMKEVAPSMLFLQAPSMAGGAARAAEEVSESRTLQAMSNYVNNFVEVGAIIGNVAEENKGLEKSEIKVKTKEALAEWAQAKGLEAATEKAVERVVNVFDEAFAEEPAIPTEKASLADVGLRSAEDFKVLPEEAKVKLRETLSDEALAQVGEVAAPSPEEAVSPPVETAPAAETGAALEKIPKKSEITVEEFDALQPKIRKKVYEQNDVTGRPGQGAFNRILKSRTANYTKPAYVASGDVEGFKVYNDRLLGTRRTDELNTKIFDIYAKHLGVDGNTNIHGDEHMAFGDNPEVLRDNLAAAAKEVADKLAMEQPDGRIYRPTMKWQIAQVSTPEEVGDVNPKGLKSDEIGFDKSLAEKYITIKGAGVAENEIVTRKLLEEKPDEERIPDTGVKARVPGGPEAVEKLPRRAPAAGVGKAEPAAIPTEREAVPAKPSRLSAVKTPRLVTNLQKTQAKLTKQEKPDPTLKKQADSMIAELKDRGLDFAGKPLPKEKITAKVGPAKRLAEARETKWQRDAEILGVMRRSSPESAKDYISQKDFGISKYRGFWRPGQGTDIVKSVGEILGTEDRDVIEKEIFDKIEFFLSDAYKTKPAKRKAVEEVKAAEMPEPKTKKEYEAGKRSGAPAYFAKGEQFKPVNIKSEAFRQWFRDSEVVDANGKPLVVYHGTKTEITEFAPEKGVSQVSGRFEGGYHFGTKEQAKMRGRGVSISVYLKAEKIKRVKDSGGGWIKKIKNAKRDGFDGIVYLNRFEGIPLSDYEAARKRGIETGIEALDRMPDTKFKKTIPSAQDSYIVFEPTQIKSAEKNIGAFSRKEADIRFAKAEKPTPKKPTPETPQLVKKFTDEVFKEMPFAVGQVDVRVTDRVGTREFQSGQEGAIVGNVIYINQNIAPARIRVILKHEIDHFGLSKIMGDHPEIRNTLENMYSTDEVQKSALVKDIRKRYKSEYSERQEKYGDLEAEDLIFNEWIRAELQIARERKVRGAELSRAVGVRKLVKDFIVKYLRKFGAKAGLYKFTVREQLDETLDILFGTFQRPVLEVKAKEEKKIVKKREELPLFARAKEFFKAVDIKSAAFKKWFGKSKVVDDKGKPLVVLHGTPTPGFSEFQKKALRDSGFVGAGYYFTPSQYYATTFAEGGRKDITETAIKAGVRPGELGRPGIYSVYLNIENPLTPEKLTVAEARRLIDLARKKRGKKLLSESVQKGYDEDIKKLRDDLLVRSPNAFIYKVGVLVGDLSAMAEDGGYDGIIVEKMEGGTYVAFEPTQIKSATTNIGAFSPTEADIRYAKKGELPLFAKEGETVHEGFDMPSEQTAMFLKRKIQDKFARLRTAQEAIKKAGREIPEKMDAYLAEELMHGRAAAGIEDIENRYVKPLMKGMAEKGISVEELGLYTYAKHAPETNKHVWKINPKFREDKIAGSGMTDAQAKQILDAFEKAGQTEDLEALAKIVYDMNEYRLEILEENGLETKEVLDSWRKAYDYYVPLKGFEEAEGVEDVSKMFPRTGKGFDIRGKESRRRLGRKSRAGNIIANAVSQTEESMVRAEKNKVGNALLNLIRENPNEKLWEVDRVERKPIFNEQTGEVSYRLDPKYKLADNVLSVKEDGKEYHITLHDLGMAVAMKNLGAEKSGKILQLMASFNRYIAMINTSLTPEFMASNFTRDIQTAVFNISAEDSFKLARKTVKDVPFAIKGAYGGLRGQTQSKWQQWFKRFNDAGGRVAFFGLENIDKQQAKLVRDISLMKPGVKSTTIRMFRSLKDLVFDLNGAVENGARLSLFKNLVESGVSEKRAASAAKNVTVNFNRKGELGVLFNSLYVFSNAGIQGTARLFKAMKSPRGRKLAAGIVTGAFLLAEMNRFLAGEDDDDENYYDKLDDWLKENNLIIMRPGTKGKYWKIPLPYGYNVFYAIGETINSIVHNTKGALKSISHLASTIANAFNPMGGSHRLIQIISPTITDPMVDLYLNENFAGNPIKPEQPAYQPRKPESELYFRSVGRMSKATAAALNELSGGTKFQPGLVDVSPELMDYVIGFATGGAGRMVNQTTTLIADVYQGKEVATRKIPFYRRMAGEVREQYDTQRFYEHAEKIEQVKNEAEYLAEYEPEKLKSFLNKNDRKNARMIAMGTRLKTMDKRIKKARKVRNAYEEAGKQEMVNRYQDLIDTEMKKFNKLWNRVFK